MVWVKRRRGLTGFGSYIPSANVGSVGKQSRVFLMPNFPRLLRKFQQNLHKGFREIRDRTMFIVCLFRCLPVSLFFDHTTLVMLKRGFSSLANPPECFGFYEKQQDG